MKYARAFDHIERLTKSFFRLLFNCTETLLNICRFLMKSGITSVDKTSANMYVKAKKRKTSFIMLNSH